MDAEPGDEPEAESQRNEMASCAVQVATDGSFRIEDVPEGRYVLGFQLFEPGPEPSPCGNSKLIGQLQAEFVVPPRGPSTPPPLDLGTLIIPVSQE